jgi:uncharacterized protein YndB with AHSA1/START domain
MLSESYSVHIDAPPEKVWAVMVDVESWPEWAESFQRVQRLEDDELGEGSTAKLRVKGAPTSIWTVIDFSPGKVFTWSTKARGVESIAEHIIVPDGAGTKVTLNVVNRGLMATLLAPFIRRIARRNIRMEGDGLKAHCESV